MGLFSRKKDPIKEGEKLLGKRSKKLKKLQKKRLKQEKKIHHELDKLKD